MTISFLNKSLKTGIYATFLSFALFFSVVNVSAQSEIVKNNNHFKSRVVAVDEVTLITTGAKKLTFKLWGIEKLDAAPALLKLKARTALDNIINGQPITCERKKERKGQFFATCVNSEEQDIGLYMLQQGYVIAARSDILGSDFERPYIDSEKQAQDARKGIWQEQTSNTSDVLSKGSWYLAGGLAVFLFILIAFVFITLIIMSGFKRVIEAQNDNVQMMSRERKLREKERSIVAVMLDSELKANKAKIEAYIVVYEEVMRGLNDPVKPPKYKKAGDILQRHPSLDRIVFDSNTDKLDILGPRLSSQLIHFYAQIKSNPEYMNIEPDMPLQEVKEMVSESLESAQRLNLLAEELIESFSAGGFSYEFDKEDTVMNLS